MSHLRSSQSLAAGLLPMLALTALSTLADAQAPIERHTPEGARRYHSAPRTSEPAPGIRVTATGTLDTVATDADRTELRLTHGTATVRVDNPTEGSLILIDLPNGQADLLKDGFYALNADANTLTVLHGEADVFAPNAPPDAKGTTVKEGESITLGVNAHPREATRAELGNYGGYGDRGGYARHNGEGYADPDWGYGAAPYYGDFYGYGYPYYPYYGYGWGYPYYGYGWGIGLGYGWGGWGGYRGGLGYRGGYGAFRGSR